MTILPLRQWFSVLLLTALLVVPLPFLQGPGLEAVTYGPTFTGNPAVARLLDASDSFFCTAVYLAPAGDAPENGLYLSWVASAGHCADGMVGYLSNGGAMKGRVNWRAVLFGRPDIMGKPGLDVAIGTVPDVRDDAKRIFAPLAGKDAAYFERVWTHGFPLEAEAWSAARILSCVDLRRESPFRCLPDMEGSAVMRTEIPIGPGASGSPVFNAQGAVVGIVHSILLSPETFNPFRPESQWVLFTPVSEIRALLSLIRPHAKGAV